MDSRQSRRRRVLRLAGATALGALAGCTDGGSGDDGDSGGGSEGTPTATDEMDDTDNGDATGEETSQDGSDEDSDSTPMADGSDDTATATTAPTETPGTDELDLREANVVGVELDSSGDDTYTFDVTLHHDDDGEEGYANWWQVERLDGTRLGRRDLAHPHSRQPFTRSETIEVPSEVTCVVVRGHDQTHGYGGRVVLVQIETGETRGMLQGSEPDSFDSDDCP